MSNILLFTKHFTGYINPPISNANKKDGNISRIWSVYLYFNNFWFGNALINVLMMDVKIWLAAIAITPYLIETSNTANPIIFLIISNFKNKSLLPTAFIASKFAVWIGHNPKVKHAIYKNGTHGSHLSVSITDINGSATTAKPTISGHITNELTLIALLVMSLTRSISSWHCAIAGNKTPLIDVLIFVTINCGNCCPLLYCAKSLELYIFPMIKLRNWL